MALSATPSSIPAKIRNSAEANVQANIRSAANATMPMPPTQIAQARSVRALRRSSAETLTSQISQSSGYFFGKKPRRSSSPGLDVASMGIWQARNECIADQRSRGKRSQNVDPGQMQV